MAELPNLVPDDRNANKGTVRGMALLEDSLRKYGAGRSALADKNGKMIAGNKTLEKAVELGIRTRIVQTDGNELVVVQRTDLDLDQDARARELAFADNRIGELDLSWEPSALLEALESDIDLAAVGFDEDELDALLNALPDESPELDERIAADLALKARWTLTFPLDQAPAIRLALAQLQEDVPGLGWKEDTTV